MRRPETRLFTLTGIGGSGKTRLAVRLAADLAPDYPHRVWFVELAAVTDAELAPIMIASTIGLRDIDSTSPLDVLAEFLATEPALLVLDNCEHLIDACAVLVDRLLNACPELRVITTSREPLQLAGERQYRVLPLAIPASHTTTFDQIAASPAVELFVNRAQDVLSSFQLTPANAVTVAQICVRLGGIPLALELAAARVHLLGIDQILSLLDDTFRFLNGGNRVAPTRHQTLQAALDWSDALLTDSERMVFRRLAVFAGEFQLATAEEVCAGEDFSAEDVRDALLGLVNKSLVTVTSGAHTAWYHLLVPVRQYAMDKLGKTSESDATRARHACAYRNLAEQAELALRGPEQQEWLASLEREKGNVRTALEWAHEHDAELELRLATAIVPFWEVHGYLVEGLRWLRLALEDARNEDAATRMRALRGAGRLAFLFADYRTGYGDAEALHRESLDLAQGIGDCQGIACALAELGMVYRLQRELEHSRQVLSKALDIFRALDDPHGIALTLLNLGTLIGLLDDVDESGGLLTESLERYQALGDHRSIAISQIMLSRLALVRGDVASAISFSVAAATTHGRLGDRWFLTFDLMALTEALIADRRPRQAVTLFAGATSLAENLGSAIGRISYPKLDAAMGALRQRSWFNQAWENGYALDFSQAVEQGFASVIGPPRDRLHDHDGNTESSPLTRRELEVARMLAVGKTDRQIAEALFVSVGTAGNHVHHILQKLELRSRAQVGAWLRDYEEDDAFSR